jgi:cell division protein FtsZ
MEKEGGDMIDLRGKHDELTGGANPQLRFRVLGLGRAGIAILDRLVLSGFEHLDMVAVDTDEQTLMSTVLQRRLLLGEKISGGLGCFGDPQRAYEIAQAEEESLQRILEGCDYLLIAAGLGGGTGGGLLPKILEMAQAERIQSIVFGTLPYDCEGEHRSHVALEQLKQARSAADCVLTTSYERLTPFFTQEAGYRKGFEWMQETESKALYSILMLLEQPGLFPLSFADLRSLYGRLQGYETSENCLIGYAEGELNIENESLLDDLLEGPLLAGEDVWKEMDRALLSVSGGKELSVLEIQEVMRQLQNRFARPLPVAVSAHFEGPQDGKIRLTLMLAKTTESHQPKVIRQSKPLVAPSLVPVAETFERSSFPSAVDSEMEPVVYLEAPEMMSDLQEERKVEQEITPEMEVVETLREVASRNIVPTMEIEASAEPESEPEFAFEMATVGEGGSKSRKTKSKKVKQEELPLEAPNRGRFEKASETFWKGENLDQPTFKRRRLYIRL